MPGRDIIVVGASAGGVEALTGLVRGLPPDLPAALFMVLHLPANSPSVLPSILSRAGRLPASHARDGEPIRRGQIYVAAPGQHLLVQRGSVHLARGPRENGHRPAVDPLFRTAARAYGRRVIGVVLSGTQDDGTAGLAAVKQREGIAVVQDPKDALFAGMPQSAMENVQIDYCLPISEIGALLAHLAREVVEEEGAEAVPDDMGVEAGMAELDDAALQRNDRPGAASGFTCPECHGALWELKDAELMRFRCRIGHAFSADSLMAEQSASLEAALWTALRALEEKAALSDRLIARSRAHGHALAAARFQEQEEEARACSEVIRRVLLDGTNGTKAAATVQTTVDGALPSAVGDTE